MIVLVIVVVEEPMALVNIEKFFREVIVSVENVVVTVPFTNETGEVKMVKEVVIPVESVVVALTLVDVIVLVLVEVAGIVVNVVVKSSANVTG